MNKTMRRRITQAARNPAVGGYVVQSRDDFGRWITFYNDIPIIAVRPFGGMAETPQELVDRVSEHIEWNSREMADALRRQARLEDTARWDVIDFP